MLSQSEIARLLDRCVDEESPELAMEEILSAYVAWKLIRGQSCALVLQKLRYLTMYLRVTCVDFPVHSRYNLLMRLNL